MGAYGMDMAWMIALLLAILFQISYPVRVQEEDDALLEIDHIEHDVEILQVTASKHDAIQNASHVNDSWWPYNDCYCHRMSGKEILAPFAKGYFYGRRASCLQSSSCGKFCIAMANHKSVDTLNEMLVGTCHGNLGYFKCQRYKVLNTRRIAKEGHEFAHPKVQEMNSFVKAAWSWTVENVFEKQMAAEYGTGYGYREGFEEEPPWNAGKEFLEQGLSPSWVVLKTCADVRGAVQRKHHSFPLCKCSGYNEMVFCGGAQPKAQNAVWHRYFDAGSVEKKQLCPDLHCAVVKGYNSNYDCNGDLSSDCGAWDYSSNGCTTKEGQCAYSYRFGDYHLGQSCRCTNAKCSLKAEGDPKLWNGHLGDTYGRWRNWANHIKSCAPWLMPKDDDELIRLLQYAASKGYKVRPSGSTHSAPGLVTDGSDSTVIVISLAHYKIHQPSSVNQDDETWEFELDEDHGIVRVNAGWTPMMLYEKIRPKDFFLPTQTAGYPFHLAGLVANSCHGGGYQRSFIHSYVTRMRVMLADGTVEIIDKKADLKYWRNSYGLLGIITALEFRLDRRERFQMFTKTRKLDAWGPDAFWKFIKQDAEADLPMHVSKHGHVNGTRAGLAGEFFVSLMDDAPSMLVVSNKANDNANEPNIAHARPVLEGPHNEYRSLSRTKIGRWYGSRLTYGTAARQEGIPDVQEINMAESNSGSIVPVNFLLSWMPSSIAAPLFASKTMSTLPELVQKQSEKMNDGFFAVVAPHTLIAAYFLAPEKAFEAFDYLRERQRNPGKFKWNQPAEFRFMNVTDDAVLQPVGPGYYFVSEILSFPGGAESEHWKEAFKEVEDHWINKLGAKPHVGKLWGFDQNSMGMVEPFMDSKACQIYNDDQKRQFDAYRRKMDPNGLFAHGLGMKLLKRC